MMVWSGVKTTSLLLLVTIWMSLGAQAQEAPKRELRGIWISTIQNLDWPPQKGLWKNAQKQAFIELLDQHQVAGINAVFVQIRPASDAFYRSKVEPWSEWLMGEQGKKPWYDPLKFMIKEAHKRGMEFHAWFNPFRAIAAKGKDHISKKHISKTHPEWMVDYYKGTYINPGIPAARQYVVKLITDVARKYDLDGIHFDDYFYPYPVNGKAFEDDATYQQYGADFSNKSDWRRANINSFIQTLNANLTAIKPHIKFGISPFGVWRNKKDDPLGSDTYASIPSYDLIYADTRLWLERGWIDYCAPQLYWSMNFKPAAFGVLLPWWEENSFGKHLYIGHALYKIKNNYDSAWYDLNEMPKQIKAVRASSAQGSIYFRSKFLLANPASIEDKMQDSLYTNPALIPVMTWKDNIPPNAPRQVKVKSENIGVSISWKKPVKASDGQQPFYYAIYRYPKGTPWRESESHKYLYKVIPATQKRWYDARSEGYLYKVSALDRLWNESELANTIR